MSLIETGANGINEVELKIYIYTGPLQGGCLDRPYDFCGGPFLPTGAYLHF